MNSVYDLSWSKDSFWAKFDLFTRSIDESALLIDSADTLKRSDGYSALSSTYYSIAGTTAAKLGSLFRIRWSLLLLPLSLPLFFLTWLPLGAWCYFRMLPLSDKALACAGGYDNFSADKCDIRQSILRKRRRYVSAAACISRGLAKEGVLPHTRALLCVGLADVYLYVKDYQLVQSNVKSALKNIREIEGYDPRQAIRIYKGCAQIADTLGMAAPNGNTLRRRARELAESLNAKDQLLKMGL